MIIITNLETVKYHESYHEYRVRLVNITNYLLNRQNVKGLRDINLNLNLIIHKSYIL